MDREQKALVEFKQIVDDLVYLLRESTGAQTAYLYWVNRSRKQFVLETNSTSLPNVMFRDRVRFEQHFLENYIDLESLLQLKTGRDIGQSDLQHYYDFVPVRHLLLIPFINNGENVAITVLETEQKFLLSEHEEAIEAYRNALANVLNTYLELSDQFKSESVWSGYEQTLKAISPKQHKAEILNTMAEKMQQLLPNGGVTVMLRGMDVWTTVLNATSSDKSMVPGVVMEEKSMAYDALQKGEPQFSIHFNQNPKRVSVDEKNTEGATLAVPMLVNGRRHGVVLAYDKNPLTFKESTKHQLINLVRIAVLSIQVNLDKLPVDKDLFTTSHGNFIPDIWETALTKEISRTTESTRKLWFGMVTIDNLQSLRSKYRLEELNRMQRAIVGILNPSNFGYHGYIGFNSDYVFTCLLFCETDDEHRQWTEAVNQRFQHPVELSDGKRINLGIKFGFIKINPGSDEVHDVVRKAKKELSGVLNATG
ncbi:MAG: GAF domain-containing protein [Bacteroidetes bacterium]|jgi:GGDEF domain-containing protein|nr:GAF domain-containing protein [Bacteroidota bacterium]